MRILGPGRAQWEWFVALHPLYEQALPPKELPVELDATPQLGNDVALIRQTIRAIPLGLPNIDLDCDLEESKYNNLSEALVSLLRVFEALVVEDVLESGAEQHNALVPEESECEPHADADNIGNCYPAPHICCPAPQLWLKL